METKNQNPINPPKKQIKKAKILQDKILNNK